MQLLFYVVSILGIAYFSLAKRRFDWFAVAFFSACTYFLPGFFGFTSYLAVTEWIESPINDQAYRVMIIVEGIILCSAIVSDLFGNEGRVNVNARKKESILVLGIIVCLAITGLMVMILTTGKALLDAEKQSMMDELNRSHILFYTSTIIGGTLSFDHRKWAIFALFCLFIMFDLFLGFRLSLAITLISIFTLWLSRQGRRRLLFCHWKQIVAGIILVIFLFLYKQMGYAVKIGDYDLLRSVLADSKTYSAMFTNSEPFVTQTILNEVTARDYHIGMEHFMGLAYQFIFYAPELGLKAISFNDLFQKDLFQEVDYGMANNIWAEMWSSGGWPLLLTFMLIFVMTLRLCCILTGTHKKVQRGIVAVMASYWACYIHRNDIGYAVVLEKRVLAVMGLSLLIAFIVRHVGIPEKKYQATSKPGGDK
jgi:hypothetical protein